MRRTKSRLTAYPEKSVAKKNAVLLVAEKRAILPELSQQVFQLAIFLSLCGYNLKLNYASGPRDVILESLAYNIYILKF